MLEEMVGEELEKRLEKFLERLGDARKEASEENIHDLRISIQRLRASCYLAGRMNGSKIKVKELKGIMNASGEVRDCHIALAITREMGGSQGMEDLLALKLQKSTEDLSKALAGVDTDKIVKRLKVVRIRETSTFDVLRIIADLFLKFKSFEDRYAEGDPVVLHRMRMSLKRLRYTMEILKGSFSFIDEGLLKDMQELQQLLGGIHDIDSFLDRFGVYEGPLTEKRRELTSRLLPLIGRVSAIEAFMKVSLLAQRFRGAPRDAMDYAEYSSHAFGCYAILREYGVEDEDILKAAILKDVMNGYGSEDEVRDLFGEKTAWLISAIKRRRGESGEDSFNRLRAGGRDVMLLKLAEARESGMDTTRLEAELKALDENL
jgi:CHAD domain-containing protein